jgi:hypothetical protein
MCQLFRKEQAGTDYSAAMEQKPFEKRVSAKNHKSNINLVKSITL